MKKIPPVILLLLLISCQQQFDPEQKLVNALTGQSITIRGNLIEIDKRTYRLDYYDVHEPDSHYEQLASKGYQGGGPSWLGITYGAIKLSNEAFLCKIRFDDEADGLAIWSSDKPALQQIGRLISVVKADEQLLNRCITVAEAHWQME